MLTSRISGKEDWRPFRCVVEAEPGRARVTLHGELDLATAPDLAQQLRELGESGVDHVLLDLRELEFMDSTGLRLVMSEDAAARADGRTFEVIRGGPAVQRIFDLACMSERLTFVAG
jgi:anti-sigma B factor antagonist